MPTKNPEARNAKNALEWGVFGLSLVLISSLLIFMGVKAVDHKALPAVLKVRIGTPTKKGEVQIVPITIENSGQVTAQNVEIEVASPEEKAGFVLDYVPREGKAEGFATFEKPVTKSQLKGRVVGYTD
jgi:uncharacterized protein (TIGR02588 family)